MKIAVIIVTYHTPESYILNIKKELNFFGINCSYYIIDNTQSGQGFASGVNKGIKRSLKNDCDFF